MISPRHWPPAAAPPAARSRRRTGSIWCGWIIDTVMAGLVPAIHVLHYLRMLGGHVYILASAPNGILYVGVTNDLVRRVYQHRNGLIAGFTKKYSVKRLVYFE